MNGLLNLEILKKLDWYQFYILGKVDTIIPHFGDEPMNKVKIEKNIKYKRADNKVVNPDFRPLNIDYDRYVTIKNNLRKKKI